MNKEPKTPEELKEEKEEKEFEKRQEEWLGKFSERKEILLHDASDFGCSIEVHRDQFYVTSLDDERCERTEGVLAGPFERSELGAAIAYAHYYDMSANQSMLYDQLEEITKILSILMHRRTGISRSKLSKMTR